MYNQLPHQRFVYLDFETEYDLASGYSLSKLPTEAYIKDERFVPYMLAFSMDTPFNKGGVAVVTDRDIRLVLEYLELDREDTMVFMHNARFDATVIEQHYNLRVRNPVCTMAMARAAGVARVSRTSLKALAAFLAKVGLCDRPKGDALVQMSGKKWREVPEALRQEMVRYAEDDVLILKQVVKAFLLYCDERMLEFIAMTVKMYTQPVFELDTPLLREYAARLEKQHEDARDSLMGLFNFRDTEDFMKAIRSPIRFRKMMEELGAEIPMKLSEKQTATRKKKLLAENPETDVSEVEVWVPAFSKNDLGFLELIDHDDPSISLLAQAKRDNNSSIAESRAHTLLSVASRGKLHVPLEPLQAWTGRYTAGTVAEDTVSDNINLQNLNKRTGDKTLRQAIRAPKGYVIVAGDSSQVEARVGAYAANEQWLVDAFSKNEDVYCEMASSIFHEPAETIQYYAKGPGVSEDKELATRYNRQREYGKQVVLSCQYMLSPRAMGIRMLQTRQRILPEDAANWTSDKLDDYHHEKAGDMVRAYRDKNPNIVNFWRRLTQVIQELLAGGAGYFGGPDGKLFCYDGQHEIFGTKAPGIQLPDGTWLVYPNLRQVLDKDTGRLNVVYDQLVKGTKRERFLHAGVIANNCVQSLSFAALRWQVYHINKEVRVLLNVHDEWVSVVPEEKADETVALYEKWLRTAPPWCAGVPFDCEVKVGRDYGSI